MTYEDSMARYGADNPDVRFGLEMTDLTEVLRNTEFKAFADPLQRGGMVKALKVEKDLSRKDLDALNEFARGLGAKGLSWVRVSPEGWPNITGPWPSSFPRKNGRAWERKLNPAPGDILPVHGRLLQGGQRCPRAGEAPAGKAAEPDPQRGFQFRLDHRFSPSGVR